MPAQRSSLWWSASSTPFAQADQFAPEYKPEPGWQTPLWPCAGPIWHLPDVHELCRPVSDLVDRVSELVGAVRALGLTINDLRLLVRELVLAVNDLRRRVSDLCQAVREFGRSFSAIWPGLVAISAACRAVAIILRPLSSHRTTIPGHTMSSADQAKAVTETMIALWEGEHPATVRVLQSVPDANRDFRPAPKSRSAWELATHLATADVRFITNIEQGAFIWDPEAAKQTAAQFSHVGDVVAFYEKTKPAALRRVRDLPGDVLAQPMDFFGKMKMSRAAWIGFAMNHSMHHRGQLSAYLRGMGSKVPNIYGDNADAEPKQASA
ncbi:MAG: DinB family protein [Gemmatimonadales bacterium]